MDQNQVGEEHRKRKKKIGRKSSNGEKENVVESKKKVGEVSRAKKRRIRKLRTNEESGDKEKSDHLSKEIQTNCDLGVERSETGENQEDGLVVEETSLGRIQEGVAKEGANIKREQATNLGKKKVTNPDKNQGVNIAKKQRADVGKKQEATGEGANLKREQATNLEKKKVSNPDKDQLADIGKKQEATEEGAKVKREQVTNLDRIKVRNPDKDQGANIPRKETADIGKKQEATEEGANVKGEQATNLDKVKVRNPDKDQGANIPRKETADIGKKQEAAEEGANVKGEQATNLDKKQKQAANLNKKQEVKKEEEASIAKEQQAAKQESTSNIPKEVSAKLHTEQTSQLDKKQTAKVDKEVARSLSREEDDDWSKEQIGRVAALATSLVEEEKQISNFDLEPLPNLDREEQSGQLAEEQAASFEKGAEGGKKLIRMEGLKLEEKKSRGDVLAEREAKKRAKQEARKKKAETPLSSEVKAETPVDKAAEVLKKEKAPHPEAVKSKDSTLKGIPRTGSESRLEVEKVEEDETLKKSKAELKAERRAKQEAQRAAKEAEKQQKTGEKPLAKSAADVKPAQGKPLDKTPSQLSPRPSTKEKKSLISSKLNVNRVKLFSHLHFETRPSSTQINLKIHPAMIRLGAKYEARVVNGSNARCVAFLQALKKVIGDYETPSEEELRRGLEGWLTRGMDYLQGCRPVSVSMTNALRHIKSHLTQLPNSIADREAKGKLCDVVDTYIHDQIKVAGDAICNAVQKKISDGDQILIYACSSVVLKLLVESHKEGTKFSCVVVDGGPVYEGRQMLRRLVEHGITTSYVLINAVSFIMRQASKVLLGAHALLANGYVMSRAGSSLIALMANSYNVPVLVCCETHKFCERVQTDAFVYNELGNPDEVVEDCGVLSECKATSNLSLLSLMYDITPPDLVTAVVTELAILPCTSVPVILRIKPSDLAT